MFAFGRHRVVLDSVVTRLLVLGLGIVLIAIAALYFALSRFLREDLSAVIEGQQLALAQYVARDVDSKVVERQTLLRQLVAALPEELLTRPAELRAWLRERYEYQPLFKAGLFVTDTRGVAIADYPALPGRVGASYADRDYIQAGLTGQAHVGRPVLGRAAAEPILPISAPKKNARGETVAVLAGITTLADKGFLDLLQQSRIGLASGGFLLISPRDRLIVASSQPDQVLKETVPPGVMPFHDRNMAGFRGTAVTVNPQGVEQVVATASVPSTGWYVAARLPTGEAFASVVRAQDFLRRVALLIVLAYVALAAVGLFFFFRPLVRATEHAQRMTRGEMPLQPLPVARADEVGRLILAFNRLLDKLNEQKIELARLAHHDTLTGLPNRALLYDRLHQLLVQARRRQTPVAVLFLDLDGFKPINDRLGHEAGDEALRQTAKRLSSAVRQEDTLARVGGDEFVLLLANLGETPEAAAATVADKCLAAMQAPFYLNGQACSLGVSIGVALGPGEVDPDALLLAADQAMYRAKALGRGRAVSVRLPPPAAV